MKMQLMQQIVGEMSSFMLEIISSDCWELTTRPTLPVLFPSSLP